MNTFKLNNKWYNSLEEILCDIDFVKKGRADKISNIPAVFDIEASSFYQDKNKCACMYAWVFGINGKCIRGRTWDEFLKIIDKIVECYGINLKKRFIIYIHNLSYEFQWFKKLFEWHKVFSLESRKPIYAITTSGIEFRCSYLLSGYNLATLGKNLLKYKVEKLVGDLDYSKIRHSSTLLTDKEWGYILNDGLVVMAHIQEEIERLGDISKLPYTKTGYVRELCRKNCLQGNSRFEYSRFIKHLVMTPEDYKQLKDAYAGGFTHANNRWVNKTLENVHSFDFTSSYPAVMLSEKFPMSAGVSVEIKNKEHFVKLLNTYCCMFDIIFYNLRSKVNFEHYISKSKCIEIENYELDNGRVVKASKLKIALTEQDFDIIIKMYEWDNIDVGNLKVFRKDYLPKDLILTILKLYKDKTSLKGVPNMESEYMISKGMINSCYGMAVTDPCKDEAIYDNETGWETTKGDLLSLIEKYNKSNSRFLFYPWGVWITAYARHNLFTGILEFKDDYVYSDTDSIKCLNYEKHKEYIENYNILIKKKIKLCLNNYGIKCTEACPKTIKGVAKQLGVWDYEGKYDLFKTLGAKRYMYVKDNQLEITISGVKKTNGVDYLFYKYKTINNIFKHFDDGLCFPATYKTKVNNKIVEKNGSGKLCHTYIDEYRCGYITDYLGKTNIFCEFSSVHMEPTSYDLSLDSLFKLYLLNVKGELLQ